MEKSFEESKEKIKSKFGVLHSRYSSSKKIMDNLAHPHLDEKNRVAIFHNGFIAEIIIYSRALNTEERKSVEAYLSKKYAIKLL